MKGFYHVFLPIITEEFNGFSADGDGVDDGLADGLTDESMMDGREYFQELDFQEIQSNNNPGYFQHDFSLWLDGWNG